jgi:hypothetical protein
VVQELAHLQEIGLVGREFRDQCQVVMRANTGINYDEFLALLKAKAADIERMLDSESVEWKREAARNHLGTVLTLLNLLSTKKKSDILCLVRLERCKESSKRMTKLECENLDRTS